MIIKTFQPIILPALLAVTFFSACSKQDLPLPDVNESELITTIRLKFVHTANAADAKIFTWKDLDGEGGNPPVIDTIRLSANAKYLLTIDGILNETTIETKDVKAEIQAEGDEHLFVYISAGIAMNVTITDKDRKGLPLGFTADVLTPAAGAGKFQVILQHQTGNKDGTEFPGSSDIDASFPVIVQ